jgi:hypothetical protein
MSLDQVGDFFIADVGIAQPIDLAAFSDTINLS